MRIGLITLSRIAANQSQYYNAQDLGLAKALSCKEHHIIVYRLTEDSTRMEKEEDIDIIYRKVKGFGKQSTCHFEFLDSEIDRLICFCDNQISFPSLYRWCHKNQVLLQPYIGVIQSNSSNRLVQMVTNTLVRRNVLLYRRIKVYGKTPDILRQLAMKKVNQTQLVPVCLNQELLRSHYEKHNKGELRKKYGYCPEDKILLFIGRLEVEKEPIEMIQILANVRKKEKRFKLLMVGKGNLEEDVCNNIKEMNVGEYVQRIPQISNQEVWELYCISDYFVNLNRHEIYGMSLLEALYYQCPVVAMNAPGPAYILNQGEIGKLCENVVELEQYLLDQKEEKCTKDSKKYLMERLSWDKLCDKFLQ